MSKDNIERLILPYLSKGKRGFSTRFDLTKVFWLIIKRLKTGCQWRELSLKEYFGNEKVSWQSIYYYFNKWSKDGSFKKIWVHLLSHHKRKLDLSSVQLDGSHTRSRMGGESVGYQGRKKGKTTSSIFLCDNLGQMLSMGTSQSGEHYDLYEIETVLEEILSFLNEAEIEHKGLFLNADAGFDSENVRRIFESKEIMANIKINPRNKETQENDHYFDHELYKRRFKIEKANAWLDSFKALLIRFETSVTNWMALHYLAFSILFIRKLKV
ncbi:IS5 family transposase [Chryseobacterium nematophagum]|uniref:IS5 family transposase n=1 Tax=Chryseobacterium nematophagum TaxID=2305228 RepID=A0A3M7TID6_9FLAO|nr:IS5 family transposase [Chryseobacterium nematophagum]